EPVATHESITDPNRLYMRLVLDHAAVNLSTAAPYDAIQLTATPFDATGAPITELAAPTFRLARLSDTISIQVTPDSLDRAIAAATDIEVIAELAGEGTVQHADTALINVTTTPAPPMLASLSIDPVPPDSAVWAMNRFGQAQ